MPPVLEACAHGNRLPVLIGSGSSRLDAPQRSQRMTEPCRIGQGRSWNVERLVKAFHLEASERTESRRALPEAGESLFWGYTAPGKRRQKFFV